MLATKPYARDRAVAYAKRWARGRNPLFYNFTGVGGDCTNFVSQCILAGSCVMNLTPDFGWYYRSVNDRAPAFTGVEYFWDFFTGAPAFAATNGGVGPFGSPTERDALEVGDVIQLADRVGDFYHTLIVTALADNEIYVSAHSNDVFNRPLSSYDAPAARFLHIEGVRFEIEETPCFEGLITGEALLP